MAEHVTASPTLPSRGDLFAVIRRSGLFDAAYYRTSNPHVVGSEDDLLEHYLDSSFAENRRPNAYFEPRWYFDTYADVAEGGMHPLLHYILHGDSENRWPEPLFNTP